MYSHDEKPRKITSNQQNSMERGWKPKSQTVVSPPPGAPGQFQPQGDAQQRSVYIKMSQKHLVSRLTSFSSVALTR